MLAPSSPLEAVQTNGVDVPSPAHRFLDVPHRSFIKQRERSTTPTPGGEDAHHKDKKQKSKSHFNMFRLHRHKSKSKKSEKEKYEEASLSSSDGSALLRQKKNSSSIKRRSFSGFTNRHATDSPDGSSVHSFPDSEEESEDELLKRLTNPTGHSPSPSPLLLTRTPTPIHQQSSMESDVGQMGGDTISVTTSQAEGLSLVSLFLSLSLSLSLPLFLSLSLLSVVYSLLTDV